MLVELKSELRCPLLETICIAGKVCGIAGREEPLARSVLAVICAKPLR
jgi:hypothetical protein